MLNQEPAFQKCAFDPRIARSFGPGRRAGGRSGDFEILSKQLDGDELGPDGSAFGFQIKNIRRQEKEIPEWARTNEGIQKVLLTAFPRLHSDPNQRKRAGRWAQFIQCYFQLGWTESEVAEELNAKIGTIHTLRRSVVRTSKGLRANGSGPRTDSVPQVTCFMEGVKDQVNP